MKVVWDADKNRANLKKHGIAFEEVRELLTGDRDYLEIFDDVHSDEEDRFIAIGPIVKGLVVIVYTERTEDVLRVISVRRATKREEASYEKHMRGNSP